jgi:DNA-binding transcriptional MerR regulator
VDKAPDAFRTISEVAEDLDLPQHVLRFWETRFAQIKPLKRGGGRRYYRPDDVELLRGIRHLLYGEGYTIKGVQRILKEEGPRFVQSVWRLPADTPLPVQSGAAPKRPLPHSPEQKPGAEDPDELDDPDLVDVIDEGDGGEYEDGPAGYEQTEPVVEAAQPLPRSDPSHPDVAAQQALRPAVSRLVGSDASLLTDADITRLQSVLFDLGECRRLIAQALAVDGTDNEGRDG